MSAISLREISVASLGGQRRRRQGRVGSQAKGIRAGGLIGLLGSEAVAAVIGFGVMVHQARSLGPASFASLEYGGAIAAWLLVVVRGGMETIVHREAARRPRLIGRLTEQLLGLKLAAALIGFAMVIALAFAVGPARGVVVAVAGLVLLPSALVADVGPRAEARLGVLAIAQLARVIGLALFVGGLVASPADAVTAAICPVLAEAVVVVVLGWDHWRNYGSVRPRFRRRAWAVLARRGAVASVIRFGRVSLFAADLLVIGSLAADSPGFGPYAAARRVAFALAAFGMVAITVVAPRIARAWAEGRENARTLIVATTIKLLAVSIPLALALALLAGPGMTLIFGAGYLGGGRAPALIALRLPALLIASHAVAALVACRRENDALRLVIGMGLLAGALLPLTALLGSNLAGVAGATLGVEAAGAFGGLWMLLGVGTRRRGTTKAQRLTKDAQRVELCLCAFLVPLRLLSLGH